MSHQYPLSYYAAVAPKTKVREPLKGDHTADVVVVGGGYSGLAAALSLAERGYSVRLVEQARVGWGASGRNGGQVTAGLAKGIATIDRLYGRQTTKQLWPLSREAVNLVAKRIKLGKIDCDMTTGVLAAAISPSHLEDVKHEADELHKYFNEPDYQVWDRAQVQSAIQTERYIGGGYDPHSFHLNPLKFSLGLAQMAEAAGVIIHEESPVLRVVYGDRPQVVTDRGTVTASFVVLATNAYGVGLVKELTGMLMPVASIIMATEPLGELGKTVYPKPIAVADCNFILDYFRPSPEGRLLFGGRAHYNGKEPADIKAALTPRMLRVFPQLAGVKIDYSWGGLIGISRNRIPQLGRLTPNVYYAQAYSGQGIALANLLGTLVAEAIDGQASRYDVFARIKHSKFPGAGRMRSTILTLAMLYYSVLDAR
ncbi:MAG: FAD-binding oxidoreductase [Candidatus Pacebacteria bacterium]|nr:FAD-binding oxidoreductase [Candidatus Paceibacterota bacterium]